MITHLMNLSMWQNRTITQLSMYAAITPLIHMLVHLSKADVRYARNNLIACREREITLVSRTTILLYKLYMSNYCML